METMNNLDAFEQGERMLAKNEAMLSSKIYSTVSVLAEWEALHHTGHFIDAHPEMKERIDAVADKARGILKSWNVVIPPQ